MPFTAAVATASPRHDGKTQDRVAVLELGQALVVVVADGAGGISGGATAAEAVVTGVVEAVAHAPETFSSVESLLELLRRLDHDVERMPHGGETTAVVVVVTEGGVLGASCGDSGAWIIGAEAHDDLTADQRRKLRVGSGRALPVPFVRALLEGTLVVASDGLFDYAKAEAICSHARGVDLHAAACGLVASVRMASGELHDDVAVAILRRRS